MKPILRALLVIDGIITLLLGLALVVSPWADSIVALQTIAPHPPALGQLFGITLLGLAWLQLHAAYDGQLTLPIARVSGHVSWVSGIVLLVWLIVLHGATVDTNQAVMLSGPAIAIVLLVIGLGLVRLASAIRRRNLLLATGAVSAGKAERSASDLREAERERERQLEREREAARAGVVEPGFTRPMAAPVPPVATPVRPVAEPLETPVTRRVVDPVTGEERIVRTTDPYPPMPEDDIRRPL